MGSSFPASPALSKGRSRKPKQSFSAFWRRPAALWVMPGLAAVARKLAGSPAARRTDSLDSTHWQAGSPAFAQAGNRMIAKCHRDNVPISILMFDQSDLPELQVIFGEVMALKMVTRLATALQAITPAKGLVVRTDATVFTVLLPGFGRDKALAAVKRALGKTFSIEFDADGDEVVLVPDFFVHTVRKESSSITDVYNEMRLEIKRAQEHEQRRQRYLRRERESHSTRPAPLMDADCKYARSAGHEMTMPVPLAMR